MRALLLVAVAGGLTFAAAAAAEPAKAPVQKAAQPVAQPAEVVVASVDNVRPPATPAAAQDSAAPVKRARRARVNSCRCGDQAAAE